ncbi:hypothetical protein [Williamsia sp. M5A3_1d]
MRSRTHSVAFLPSTSALATAVLTIAWWLTMIGLTTPSPPHVGVALTSAAIGATVIALASHPQARSTLSRWVFRCVTAGRGVVPPGTGHRWTSAHRAPRTPASHQRALTRAARPRAPGQGFVTA